MFDERPTKVWKELLWPSSESSGSGGEDYDAKIQCHWVGLGSYILHRFGCWVLRCPDNFYELENVLQVALGVGFVTPGMSGGGSYP